MTTDVIEGEVVSRELVPQQAAPPPTLFGVSDPGEVLAKAERTADVLMAKVRAHTDLKGKHDLVMDIQGKEHICVGGWTLLGSLVGVFPVCVWTRQIEGPDDAQGRPHGWEARVEARTLAGQVVGAAEAMCSRTEKMWMYRDDYALKSMAQTRATSKALRMPLGFIASLAGFEGTPAEEMTFAQDESRRDDAGSARYSGPAVKRTTARKAAPKASPAATPDMQKPLCPEHQIDCEYVPAGTSTKTGKKYGAFYSCPNRDCTAGNGGRRFSIFLEAWQDILSQQANENAPQEEGHDFHDLPNEQ